MGWKGLGGWLFFSGLLLKHTGSLGDLTFDRHSRHLLSSLYAQFDLQMKPLVQNALTPGMEAIKNLASVKAETGYQSHATVCRPVLKKPHA